MSRARSGQIERKKSNCTKPLICHGERQHESPLNFAHDENPLTSKVLKKIEVFIGYLVETWIAQKKNQKYTVNSCQTDTCLITCHQAVFFLKTKEHLIRVGYLSKMGNSRLLFSHFIVGNISLYSLRWTVRTAYHCAMFILERATIDCRINYYT